VSCALQVLRSPRPVTTPVKSRQPSARAVRNAELMLVNTKVHQDNTGVYGARKVWAQMNREGHPVAQVHRGAFDANQAGCVGSAGRRPARRPSSPVRRHRNLRIWSSGSSSWQRQTIYGWRIGPITARIRGGSTPRSSSSCSAASSWAGRHIQRPVEAINGRLEHLRCAAPPSGSATSPTTPPDHCSGPADSGPHYTIHRDQPDRR
jgi:hypothetical protein